MKKFILKGAAIVFVAVSMIACKDNKETSTTDVEVVADASDAAVGYEVDVSKSVITWKGEKPTGSHTGTLKLAGGKISVSDRNLEAGNFTIDMTTLTNTDMEGDGKASLEAHLMGTAEGRDGADDFFNVPEFPTATFEVTSIEGTQYNPTVKGNLTIKGKTNAIEFPATVSYPGETMFLKSQKFMIDRTKWGINYGSKSIFDDLGDKFVNDEIELQVELHAKKA